MDLFIGIYLSVGVFFLLRWYGAYRRQRRSGFADRLKFALFTLAAWPLALYWNWRKQLRQGP